MEAGGDGDRVLLTEVERTVTLYKVGCSGVFGGAGRTLDLILWGGGWDLPALPGLTSWDLILAVSSQDR